MAKKKKFTAEEERIRDAAPDMLTALKCLLSTTTNREALMAVEIAKRAIKLAEGSTIKN